MKNPWRQKSKVNPQRENGRRRINNEVFQALIAAKLPGAVFQVILVVIDRTWGYDKLYDYISFSQFTKAINLSGQSISNAITQAEARRLIVIERDGRGRRNKYLFNKHYDVWLTSQANHTRISQPLKANSKATTERYINNIKDDDDRELTEYFSFIEKNLIGKLLRDYLRGKARQIYENYPLGRALEAAKITVEKGGHSLRYLETVLKNWDKPKPQPERHLTNYPGSKKPFPKIPKHWPGQEDEPGVLRSAATGKVIGYGR